MTQTAPLVPAGDTEAYTGQFMASFNYDVRLLPPGPGGALTTLEHFIYIANDAAINQAFVQVTQANFTPTFHTKTSMTLQIIQKVGDQREVEITDKLALDSWPAAPLEMPIQEEQLAVGYPVYIRAVFNPTASPASPWYQTMTAIQGTLHLLSTI
jgi:hypothetical protein